MAHGQLRASPGRWFSVAVLFSVLASCAGPTLFVAPTVSGEPIPYPVWVEFEGVDNLSEFRLRRAIEDLLIEYSRDPRREAWVMDAALELEDFYRQEGFPDVSIGYTLGCEPPVAEDQPERVTVTFEVDEGPLVTVGDMRLFGTGPVDRESLLDFWYRRHSGSLGFGEPILVESDIVAFANSIELYYRFSGYLDATVDEPRIERSPGGDQAIVTILVDSGPKYRIGKVTISEPLEQALGDTALVRPEGVDAASGVLEEFLQSVIVALQSHGYPDPVVKIEHETKPDHRVDLSLTGEPGRRAEIASIELEGNAKTRDWVILNRLDIEVGQVYDGAQLDKALRKLYLTGLFRKVEIQRKFLSDDPADERLALVVETDEEDSRSLDLLVGWGSYELLRGAVRVQERNLFGTGRNLSVEGKISTKGYLGSATVTDQDFLGTDNTLSVRGEGFAREEPSYVDRGVGGTIALSRELTSDLDARIGYTLADRHGSTDVVGPAGSVDQFREGRLFGEVRYDRRDSVLLPREGYQIYTTVDGMDPALGATVSFARARFAATGHIPVTDVLNLSLRTDQGWLWPGDGPVQVPIQERFFNGGDRTVRSFKKDQLGPKDVNGNPTGGEYRNVFTAELRAPLFWLLEGSVFADAGNVGVLVQDYGVRDLRYAIGAGIRLVLPIGPVRLDAGWNPNPRFDEDPYAVHFTIGYPF